MRFHITKNSASDSSNKDSDAHQAKQNLKSQSKLYASKNRLYRTSIREARGNPFVGIKLDDFPFSTYFHSISHKTTTYNEDICP